METYKLAHQPTPRDLQLIRKGKNIKKCITYTATKENQGNKQNYILPYQLQRVLVLKLFLGRVS